MKFSSTEIKDLIIAWALISLAFGIVFRAQSGLAMAVVLSALTVGVGFLVHELAHKAVAQHLGKFAEFRAFLPTLILAVVMAWTGIVIAAPGAVMISGFVNRKETGMIGAAGPLANLALCALFLPLLLVAAPGTFLALVASFGFYINALLALFNLLPFWIFDGAKIIAWNKPIYAALVVVSVILVFFSSFLGVF